MLFVLQVRIQSHNVIVLQLLVDFYLELYPPFQFIRSQAFFHKFLHGKLLACWLVDRHVDFPVRPSANGP